MVRRDPLTASQKATFIKIKNLIRQLGYSPSYREIGGELGIQAVAARKLVLRLEAKGYIGRADKKSRSLRVL